MSHGNSSVINGMAIAPAKANIQQIDVMTLFRSEYLVKITPEM